ncbi:hypothetical protein QJQ45_012473 [Haematococcus lacustris]|nr:hypothetical protein QJQ45_012473 [Haematococcus lacustris]
MGGKRLSKKQRQQLQELHASPKAGFKCSPSGLKAQVKKAQDDATELRAQVERLHQQLSDAEAHLQQVRADTKQLQAALRELLGENEALEQLAEERTHAILLLQRDKRRLSLALRNVRRCRPSGPRLTRHQQQLMKIMIRHRVSPGIPSSSEAQQPCPSPDPPTFTTNFIPTQVGRCGKPAARTAAYLAQHYLCTARLVLQTQVSRRKLAMCRELFVNEQCLVPNPHRPGQSTTVGRQLRVVAKYLKSKTLEMLKQAKAIHLAFDGCTTKRHGKVLVIRVTAAVPKPQGQEEQHGQAAEQGGGQAQQEPGSGKEPVGQGQPGHEGQVEHAGQSCSTAAPRLTTIFTDVLGVIQLASGTAEAHVRVIMRLLGELGLAGMNIAGICADSASVNMGEFTGVIARISQLLREEGQVGVTRAQPCYSHGIHNTLLKGLVVLPGTRAAITDLSSLLAQHWVVLKLDRWGAKPETPCDTRWASYITAASSLLAIWRHAGDAVAEILECKQRRAPAWARELCKHLQDSDLLLKITVVAVVGQTYLMPELLWASKDDGLHAFELYRHIQQVCKGLQQPWANNAQLLSQLHSKLQQLVPADQDTSQRGVVVNVGDHASQQRVAAAAAAGCNRVVPAGVQPPPQQPPQQQGRSSWGTALGGQMLAPPVESPQGPTASPDLRHMYQLALAAIATQGQAAPAQGSELGAAAPAPGFTLRKRTTPAGLGLPKTAAKRKR